MADTTLLNTWRAPDLRITRDDLAIDDGLATAVLISLFSDARVEDERGWWADDAQPGWGSELWRYERESIASINLAQVKAADEKALAWLVADGVLSAVRVEVTIEDGVLVHRVMIADLLGQLLTIDVSDPPTVTPGPPILDDWLLLEDGTPLLTESSQLIEIEP